MRKLIKWISLRVLLAFFLFSIIAALGLFGSANARPLSECDALTASTKIRQGTIGKHFMLLCQPEDKSTVFYWYYVCIKGEETCDEEKIAKRYFGALLSPGSKASAIASFKADWSCAAPPDKYKPLCAEHVAIREAEWAEWLKEFKIIKYVWKVKPNGTQTTRPAYALVNGVVGTKEVARAPVGALCIADKPTSGSDLRAQWQGGPDGVVALCSKVAQ